MAQNEDPFFKSARKVSYSISYGFIQAGVLEFKSDTTTYSIEAKKCHKMEIIGKTTGAAAAFANIHNRWISYVDVVNGLPFRFIRELQENSYTKEELTEFDRDNNIAVVSDKSENDEFEVTSKAVPTGVHDMVSAYLALNAQPLHLLNKNDSLQFNVFVEDTTYAFKIKYLGKETIKTTYGKKEAYKLSPIMPANSVFSDEEDLLCWISADKDKIPLRFRAKLAVGAIEMELTEYSGYKR